MPPGSSVLKLVESVGRTLLGSVCPKVGSSGQPSLDAMTPAKTTPSMRHGIHRLLLTLAVLATPTSSAAQTAASPSDDAWRITIYPVLAWVPGVWNPLIGVGWQA
jgi:hypothetical protein